VERSRRSQDIEDAAAPKLNWRRNLYAVMLGELLAIAGFNSAMPFMPYFVQELGITAPGQVELWSGLLSSVQAWTMGIMSPIWGSLADRLGRKLMLTRALFGGAVLLGAMSLTTSVQQLLLLRLIQGAVTGTVAAAYTLVAACAPSERRAFALGLVQMAVYLGASLGPSLGGLVADSWGYRASFVVTGMLLGAGGVVVAILVRESRSTLLTSKAGSLRGGLRLVVGSPRILTVFGIRFLVSAGLRIVNPMLPLFVQALAPSEGRIASLTGIITSVTMVATSIGSVTAGRYAGRVGVRKVLLTSLIAAGVCYSLMAAVQDVSQLLVLRGLSGLALGGTVSALSAALAAAAPDGRQGTVFGLQSSVHSLANALGPVLGGVLAASWGLRLPFVVSGLGFGLAAGLLVLVISRAPLAN
jgi:DHA1 family multidrug resistance protein-like MFS transporter